MDSKRIKLFVVLLLSVVLMLGIAACGSQDQAEESEPAAEPAQGEVTSGVELTDEQLEGLMTQVAQHEIPPQMQEYVPDESFANAEVFGIDRIGNEGVIYAFLNQGEYAVIKDKAYDIAGSAGEVMIRFNYTEDTPELIEVVWSADGADHDNWLEENFPEKYYEKAIVYDPYDSNGYSILGKKLDKIASQKLGVPVETENIVECDEDLNYKIIKITESGTLEGGDYKFDTEVLEEGNLKDLKQ